ncbi:hypothetical protein [Isoptericola cucumis]|uniref:Glyoxalase/bleomycin resistance protein/dioxygenase n=1 Tax=Isoptericola cucumis TaxID=1776856 RepID=A0ABQ2BE40_9MICO|nr:hypothetical protein [Isoptericola cucumis]GGI12101.1 hypothetical protein GCM10007368_39490 [Isoptericola cucumis]
MTGGSATAATGEATGDVFGGAFDDVAARTRMIPLLPCGDVDEMASFWTALGLELTYRQVRPYPVVSFARGGIALQYYGMPAWDPEASHSTCVLVVPDTEPLYAAFAAGLRALHGRLPTSGVPRVTRPRTRANNAGLSGFSVVDPAGNWVRVSRAPDEATPITAGEGGTMTWTSGGGGPLARATENAVVVADSKGDVPQARKVLAGAVRRARAGATPPVAELAPALAYLVELAVRSGDPDDARERFSELEGLADGTTTADERSVLEASLAEAAGTLRDA